jgi:hypothetical protein
MFQTKRELYRAAIISWANKNEYQLCEHIINITISVLFTRDAVLIGGDFAKSFCNNDLFGVCRHADKEVFANLKYIVSAYHNISIAEYLAFELPNPELAKKYVNGELNSLKIM